MQRRVSMARWLRSGVLWLACLMLSWSLPGVAAAAGASDSAAAQALFDDGRQLMKTGRLDEACAKFEESNRLDSRVGTMLNLADCLDRAGRTASAWAQFNEVAVVARKARQMRRYREALRRAKKLEGRLSKLRIDVTDSPEDLVVVHNTKEVRRAAWGTAIPVDPGEHTIGAMAPGKRPWDKTVVVDKAGATVAVVVPALGDAPNPVDQDEPGAGNWNAQKSIGVAVGGAGLVGILVGAIFAVVASDKNDESKSFCATDDPNQCTAQGVSLRDQALDAQTGSIVGFLLGGFALTGGLVVFFTAPSSPATRDEPRTSWQLSMAPRADGTGATLSVGATW